jgi:hypothetical protein
MTGLPELPAVVSALQTKFMCAPRNSLSARRVP